ncbi:F0F1 ATP synthase subunit delta [Hahella sp. SMD15-11]|uniref:ATP synthase subunit delta n=1 Tax=Thermohahella caldifontis TaxID=3142973 RepID=A0AB39UT64_9GAMM
MAESTTLARPYAKAAFELAREANRLDAWADALAFMTYVVQDAEVAAVIGNPGVTSAGKASLIIDILDGRLDEAQQNFVRLLAENKRLALIPQIEAMFKRYKAAEEASVDVTIETAYELDGEQESLLVEALKKKLNRTVRVSSEVKRSLIGGVVIRAGDLVIDGSIRGRLNKLAEALAS